MATALKKQENVFKVLKEQFGYKNTMQAPKIEKVIVSIGVGSVSDKAKRELIKKRLASITGQMPAETKARKSIATFKVREGDVAGFQVTLRGDRMRSFLDKLIHVTLPRTRDFRGLKVESVDAMGNYTLGIKEHTVFPETADEDIRDVFGLGITIGTTAKTKEEALALLREIGLPLRKEE